MPRWVSVSVFFSICLCSADVSAYTPVKLSPANDVKAAVDAALCDDWKKAAELAKKTADAKVVKLVEWLRLTRATDGSVDIEDMQRFMTKNAHFPRIYAIRRNAEKALLERGDNAALAKWFKKHPPVTPAAVIKHAELLMAKKDWERAVPMLYRLWAKGELSDDETQEVKEKLSLLLDEHDYAGRVEALLDERKPKQAQKLLGNLGDESRRLAVVRIGLMNNDAHAVRKIKSLPEKQRKNAGLMFDELRWLRNKSKYDDAVDLLKSVPLTAQRGDKWWNERMTVARQLLNGGRAIDAYDLVKTHALTKGGTYADAEWMAGWIALRDLKQSALARKHFSNMLSAVKSPVSLARGEYWMGRAFEDAKNKTEARRWYRMAARRITTIYGQLAARRLKKEALPELPLENAPTLKDMDDVRKNELFQIAKLLQQAGQNELTDVFAARLTSDAKTSEQTTALAYALAEDLQRPDLAVNIARRARANGTYIVSLGYPVWDLKHDERAEQALVLSIIRQESNFSTDAVSPAGARGLMQILPSTAKQIARKKKKKFSAQMLNSNPDFNVEMGSTYFADMLKRFDGSYVLAVAAYNAGPTNVRKWMKTMGKPDERLDAIDWIERIPFGETRNYVQRVLENLHIYRRNLNYPETALDSWQQAKKDGKN